MAPGTRTAIHNLFTKMKRLITSIILCFAAIAAMAQEKANICVSYVQKYKNHTGFDLEKKYVLYTNGAISKFCDPVAEYVDSLCSTPKGKEEYNMMLTKAIESGSTPLSPSSTLCVFQSLTDNNVNVFDQSGSDYYTYTEPMDEMEWTIVDSTKIVLGYECIMATSNYHGREWTAWFSPEIPATFGPWKLHGLPGLILEAVDADKIYLFEATGLEGCSKKISPLYSKSIYSYGDRKEMLKAARYILDNPYAYLAAITGQSVEELKDDEEEEDVLDKNWDYLETDYR